MAQEESNLNPLSLVAWVAAFFLAASLFSHTVALRLLLLMAGAALVLVAAFRDRSAFRLLPPIWIAFLAWGAWAGLSALWSAEPERTIKDFRNEVGYTAVALLVCHAAAQARNAARVLIPVLSTAAVGVCAVAVYYYVGERYPDGAHGGSGSFSSALLTLLPCFLMIAWYGHRSAWPRMAVYGAVAIALLFIPSAYTAVSRTVWLGFAAQLLIIGAAFAWRYRARFSRTAALLAGAASLAIVAGAIAMTLVTQEERKEMSAARTFEDDPRFKLWPEVMERVQERPLTGHGFGRGVLRHSLREETGDRYLWHSHNLFLDMVLQTGLPGLALLVWLLGATARQGWRLARSPNDIAAACGIALLGVLTGMVIRNMTDVLWVRQNALLYWGIVGVLLAWGTTAARAAPPRD